MHAATVPHLDHEEDSRRDGEARLPSQLETPMLCETNAPAQCEEAEHTLSTDCQGFDGRAVAMTVIHTLSPWPWGDVFFEH